MKALETYQFPNSLIEAAMAAPPDYLRPDALSRLAQFAMGFELSQPAIKQPLLIRMTPEQLQLFEEELTKPTPIIATRVGSTDRFEAAHLALAASWGRPMSLPEIRSGEMIQSIVPTADKRQTANSSYGSEQEFAFHNDMSFLPEDRVPDYVILACRRNHERAATLVSGVDAPSLAESDVAQLRQSNYLFRHAFKSKDAVPELGHKQGAIILPNGEVRLGVDMESYNSQAERALIVLKESLRSRAAAIALQPGEFLVLPNKYILHAREPFRMARQAPNRRWLQRVNVIAP